MSRNLVVKLILLGVWLTCYLPYRDVFLATSNQKAMLHLGELHRFDDVAVYERWEHCLAYLNEHDIKCSIRVKCQPNNLNDAIFSNWLARLELDGHQMIHEEYCTCNINSIGYRPAELEVHTASFVPLLVSRNQEEPNLLLSLPSPFFRNQFNSLARRSNYFVVEGDPTNWGVQQFYHFQQNIQYLLLEGISFDNP